MKEIPLTQGKVALVDDEDFERVNQFKWCVHLSGVGCSYYALRTTKKNRTMNTIRMHNLLMNPPVGLFVDHKNGDGLDNRRENLRICSVSQNAMNQKRQIRRFGEYKGVREMIKTYKNKTYSYIVAYIRVNGKQIFLGNFSNKVEAANAYDDAARIHFGEFARTNF